MTDALIKVFAVAGIQWMGWGLLTFLIIVWTRANVKRETAYIDLVERNTTALITLTLLIKERLPRGGRE